MSTIAMIDPGCGRMRPLYEAMSICSSTIEWLDREGQEHADYEFQVCIAKLVKAIEEFIEFVGVNPLTDVPIGALQGLVWCVETLNSMTQLIIRKTRGFLPSICDEFRETIGLLLNQVDSLTAKVEDILESWQLGVNADSAEGLGKLVSLIDRTKTDIPDWRQELELIPD
jgi:hypothetical protein